MVLTPVGLVWPTCILVILSGISSTTTTTSQSILLDFPHGFYSTAGTAYCKQCVLSYMIMANLYRLVHLPIDSFIENAKRTLTNTEMECRKESHRLDSYVRAEMMRQRFHTDLVHECPLETIPYNLFLCKMKWDAGVGDMPDCGSSCGGEIKRWTRWHQRRGVTQFPPGWFGQFRNMEDFKVKRDVRPTPSNYTEFESAKQFRNGLTMNENTGYVRRKRQHGVLPKRVPRRFIKEFFHTNELSIGNWTRQARCDDDEWPFAIEDGLPFGITIHCWGPLGFAGTHTIGVQMWMTKPHFVDCNKTVEYKPPNGTLLIGMSNRIKYYSLEFLVAGVFLCSGEEKWTKVKPESEYNTMNGTGEIARCDPGTIICTIELKMAEFESKSFTTDIRVGCCDAPDRLFYSSSTLVPMRTTRFSKESNRTIWTDSDEGIVNDASDVRNISLIVRNNFTGDVYADPYGGFISGGAVPQAGSIVIFRGGINLYGPADGRIDLYLPTWVLYFGQAEFNNMAMKEWSDQNPVFKDRPRSYNTCEKGFVKGMQMRLCSVSSSRSISISLICTNGGTVPLASDCEDNDIYKFECPPNHLICGVRKTFPELQPNGYLHVTWFGYKNTFICCPVVHTAASICGPSGVVLSIEDAEVNCISVSGADTKCTTVQSYGYTMGSEIMNGTTVDTSTEDSFGYSTTKRLEVVASASVTVSQSAKVSGGVPAVATAEVETSVSGTFGVMTTAGKDTTNSETTTDRKSEAFSFHKAITTEETSTKSTTTEYTILDGQRALFYDVVRTCGATKLKSEDFIRILTPSLKCDAKIAFEYVFGWRTQSHGYNMRTFTFFGFGLEIEEDTFVHPLERGVNWDLISLGVKEKFVQSISLSDENGLYFGGYDFKRAPPALWQRSTNNVRYNVTVNLQYPYNYRFYRLLGKCGRWKAITNSIVYQREQEHLFGYLNEPPSLKYEFLTSPSVWKCQ